MLYIYRIQVDALKCVLHKALNIKLAINGQAHRMNDANKHGSLLLLLLLFHSRSGLFALRTLTTMIKKSVENKSKPSEKQKLLFSKCLLDTLNVCACLKEDCRYRFSKVTYTTIVNSM